MARKRTIRIRHPELTDEQWEFLAEALPEPAPSTRGGPKPIPNRPVVEGILWVLRNGALGKLFPRDIPRRAPAGDGWPSGKRPAYGSFVLHRACETNPDEFLPRWRTWGWTSPLT